MAKSNELKLGVSVEKQNKKKHFYFTTLKILKLCFTREVATLRFYNVFKDGINDFFVNVNKIGNLCYLNSHLKSTLIYLKKFIHLG